MKKMNVVKARGLRSQVHSFLLISHVVAVVLFSVCAQAGVDTSTLRVTVTNIRSDSGDLAVAIFPKEEAGAFPKDPKVAIATKVVQAQKGETVVEFEGLEPGSYAVSLLHDENRDGKMNFNFVGMPKEGFGFSRDPKIYFGAPDFSKCEIEVGVPATDVQVTTKYF